jgi:hypothetical protein
MAIAAPTEHHISRNKKRRRRLFLSFNGGVFQIFIVTPFAFAENPHSILITDAIIWGMLQEKQDFCDFIEKSGEKGL